MDYWNRFPLFRMSIPLVLGILLATWLQESYPILNWLLVMLLVLGFVFIFFKEIVSKYRNRWFYGVMFHMFLILAGYQIVILQSGRFDSNNIINLFSENEASPEAVVAKIVSPAKLKGKWVQSELEIEGYYSDGKMEIARGRVKVNIERNENAEGLIYGDRIIFSSKLNLIESPLNPDEFSHKDYLALQSIYHQAFIKGDNWQLLESKGRKSLMAISAALRDKLLNIFRRNGMGKDELAVASALILGDKSGLNTDLKSNYSKSGAMHVLAVSGLHVGIIYLVLNWLLAFLARLKYGAVLKATVIILLLWFYAMLTGMSPSVMRATTMLSFLVIGKSLNQYTDIYNILIVSAFLLLVIDPNLIVSVGFQLSYLAVFGIVYLYPKFYCAWEPPTWLLDKVWALTCVSLAAQLATFPLSLYYFHQFPNWFLISNLLVIPLATIIIYLGILVFITAPFHALSVGITEVMTNVVGILNESVSIIRSLPFSTVEDVSIDPMETVGIYMIISLVISFFVLKRVAFLRWALVSSVLLLMFQVYENQEQLQQRQVIVYSIPHHTAVEFINGKTSLLLADSALLASSRTLDYYSRNYRISKGIKFTQRLVLGDSPPPALFDSWFNHNNYFQFFDYSMLIVGDNGDIPNRERPIPIGNLLLRGRGEIEVSEILKKVTPQHVLLGSSLQPWKSKKWAEEFDKYGFRYINIPVEGAHISIL
ncbi:MAG TPA: ComEC family competence protein [Flavobacteriales bacterium]|nr:ComEC family competence protein [Flavobacteriales bacterium]